MDLTKRTKHNLHFPSDSSKTVDAEMVDSDTETLVVPVPYANNNKVNISTLKKEQHLLLQKKMKASSAGYLIHKNFAVTHFVRYPSLFLARIAGLSPNSHDEMEFPPGLLEYRWEETYRHDIHKSGYHP